MYRYICKNTNSVIEDDTDVNVGWQMCDRVRILVDKPTLQKPARIKSLQKMYRDQEGDKER